MRGTGDRPIDAGELAAAFLVLHPNLGWDVHGCVALQVASFKSRRFRRRIFLRFTPARWPEPETFVRPSEREGEIEVAMCGIVV